MRPTVRVQLSVLMFLQFFVWGSWYVTMGTYLLQTLQFSGEQNGAAYGTLAIAAMISPFFVGMVADRLFATERVLGVLHLVGAGLMFLLTRLTDFSGFYWVLLAYTLCYSPTIALSNAISFRNIENPDKNFSGIRVLGTLGWIAAGLLIDFLGVGKDATPMLIAAVSSAVLGLYCFTLPHTPPVKRTERVSAREILGLDALALMKERSFGILVISSVLICIPLSFYYSSANPFLNEVGMENPTGKMTLGQMSEFIFLLLMPFFFVRLGVKKMIMVGMAAWVIRYILFAYGNSASLVWMLYGGIILHGICYDFFFVTGQIFVNERAPEHLKSAVQGLITFATYGLGMFIGTWLSGVVVDAYAVDATRHDWQAIWLVPALASAIVLVIFTILFRDRTKPREVPATPMEAV